MLDDKQLDLIEVMAEGMAREEVLSYWDLTWENLSEEDKAKFDARYKRGRVNMIMFSVRNLKQAMQNSKTGMAASLAALTQFGQQWQVADQVSKVKSFKITLDD